MNDGLLLSELEIALNDVVAACIEAGDIHATAAEACEDAALSGILAALADSRREAAGRIGDYLATHGEGPNTPTEEREMIKMMVTRTRSALSGDPVAALLSDCLAEEERVRDTADAALALAPEGDLASRLHELRADAERRIGELKSRIGEDRG